MTEQIAIAGDLHSNVEAAKAFFKNLEQRNEAGANITRILSPGDIVGYGPEPRELTKMMAQGGIPGIWMGQIDATIGNHDYATDRKSKNSEYPINSMSGFKAKGSFSGIHHSVRDLVRKASKLPDEKDFEGRKAWRAQVEADTQRIIEEVNTPGYVEAPLQAIRELIPGNISAKRFASGSNVIFSNLEKLVQGSDVANLQKIRDNLDEYTLRREDEMLRNYLGNLNPVEYYDTPLGRVMLVHDNPYKPGDSMYSLDIATKEEWQPKSPVHTFDKIFEDWAEMWPDVDIIILGHSHAEGIYEKDGKIIINPGSIGIPRGKNLENMKATYVLGDPTKKGLDAFEVVELYRCSWKTTQRKMRKYNLNADLLTHKEAA